jgi:hypothetical protein
VNRWLKVLLLKPQTRQHPLLLEFLGLQPGWGSNELGFAGAAKRPERDVQMADLSDPGVSSGKLAM